MQRSRSSIGRWFVDGGVNLSPWCVSAIFTAVFSLVPGAILSGQDNDRCTLRSNDTVKRCEVFDSGDPLTFFRGTEEPPENWYSPDFVEDDRWVEGGNPIGYGEDSIPFETELTDMRGGYISFFVRASFTIENLSQIRLLRLLARYDDGLVVYLNGQEIDRPNLPNGELKKDTQAGSHEFNERPYLRPFVTDLDALTLFKGTNVLAVRLHNTTIDSSDAVLDLKVRIESNVTESESGFRRGDADAGGSVNITDAINVLGYLFRPGGTISCEKSADANDDGKVNISDALTVLGHLFRNTGPLPEPTACGSDPTPDELGCDENECE